ncbi:MAG: DUF3592 domain-containing protein [Huintestinicola sp.]|uniref:hypothetical protein n=1 Tax=Huintestinicola sp. TaxID=2981661 RepID=UPI003F08A90F
MKLKKRYIVACVLLCIAAVALCVGVFNIEMGLARYSKLNKVTSETWYATSASDLETRQNTDFFITEVLKGENAENAKKDAKFTYLGKQAFAKGKYVAYNQEKWGGPITLNGKNPATGEDYKMGDRVSVYYKPDNPKLIYVTTDYTMYLIILIALLAAAVALIIVCRIVNKNMKDNTFSEAAVTIMDIPMAVLVAGFILSFFAGMLIGNIQVDATYTVINDTIAAQLEAGELTF